MATTLSSRSEKTKPAKIIKKVASEAESPSETEVRLLAYRLYEKRLADGASGDAASDWIAAERLLSSLPDDATELD